MDFQEILEAAEDSPGLDHAGRAELMLNQFEESQYRSVLLVALERLLVSRATRGGIAVGRRRDPAEPRTRAPKPEPKPQAPAPRKPRPKTSTELGELLKANGVDAKHVKRWAYEAGLRSSPGGRGLPSRGHIVACLKSLGVEVD